MTKQVYIDRNDISLVKKDNFYGIEKGKLVSLKYFGVIKILDIIVQNNAIKSVNAELISKKEDDRKKLDGQLHWISANESK